MLKIDYKLLLQRYKEYMDYGSMANNDAVQVLPAKMAVDLGQMLDAVEVRIGLGGQNSSWALAYSARSASRSNLAFSAVPLATRPFWLNSSWRL
jgi:hypothetical protein